MGEAFERHGGSKGGFHKVAFLRDPGSGRGGKGTITLGTRQVAQKSFSSQSSLMEASFEEIGRVIPIRVKENVY